MKNSLMVIVAGGLLCVSTASVGQTQQTSNTVEGKAKQKETTYCLQSEGDSGSHVKRVECRTKKEWKALGVDLDEDKK